MFAHVAKKKKKKKKKKTVQRVDLKFLYSIYQTPSRRQPHQINTLNLSTLHCRCIFRAQCSCHGCMNFYTLYQVGKRDKWFVIFSLPWESPYKAHCPWTRGGVEVGGGGGVIGELTWERRGPLSDEMQLSDARPCIPWVSDENGEHFIQTKLHGE